MLKERKKYSLRKYKVGLFSVLVGVGIGISGVNTDEAKANEIEKTPVVEKAEKTQDALPENVEKKEINAEKVEKNTEKTVDLNTLENKASTPENKTISEENKSSSEKIQKETLEENKSDSSINKENTAERKETNTTQILVQLKKDNNSTEKEQFLNDLSRLNISYKKLIEYDTLFSGFALETLKSNVSIIQSLPQVSKVSAGETTATTNKEATTDAIKPQTDPNTVSEENTLINLQPLWDRGIKGQGRIVAVLDTGLDIAHNMFQLTDKSKARYKNEAELEAAKKKAGINYGKWYNDKVIFAYNYSDMNDDIKEFDTLSHGTHVSGSAVGNATEPAPTGDIIKGVAPEAQLMFMRLFSERKGGTQQSFIMVKAIEDAVKLGADSINMSFGSPTGMIDDLDDTTREALELAKKAGVTIVTAGGNYATSGYWHAKPKADNPDYGTVNTPAVDPNVLAIGAYNASVAHNTKITLDVPQLKDNSEFNNGHTDVVHYLLTFNGKENEKYVYLPKGDAGSYSDSSVAGKIVLVESGGSVTDNDKLIELRKAGAKGVLIYQTKEQGDVPTKLYLGGYESSYIPVGIIGNKLGEELAKNADKYTLNITDTVTKVPYKDAKKMLYFSGWGVSTEGELKPDVVFPGGMIYSAINNGLYYMNSGTSMATPHAAGAVALIKQALLERFPNMPKDQLEELLQRLVMSTAKPAVNPESNTYYSPRQQGAGLADVYEAAFGDLYLTTKDKKPSVTLGNVGEKFDFEVTIHNISDKDKTVDYNTVVNTDAIENGRVTLASRKLLDVKGETIIVPANSSKTVKISVDTSNYTKELSDQMKNGYFLEGFVFFKDSETKKELVSAPFLGFKGEFENLRGIEKPIYEYTGDEKPFYYYVDDKAEKPVKDNGNYFTSIVSNAYINGTSYEMVLGENGEKYDGNALYFSPNGDGDYDSVKLKAVLLRNVDNINLKVYKKDDVDRTTPIYDSGNESQRKSDYGWAINDRSAIISSSDWNGKDKEGNLMPDGEYQYVITYRPSSQGAKPQELNFVVKIDNTKPKLENSGNLYNKDTRVFNPGKIIEEGSGLSGEYLSYEKDGETIAVEKQADGTYILPEGIDVATVRFYIWDNVNNTATLDINGNLIVPTNNSNSDSDNTTTPEEKDTRGRLEVKFTDGYGNDYAMYPEIARYLVFDEAGNRLDVELNSHYETELPVLPYGKYTVKIVAQDSKVTWLSDKEVTVTIDKDNPQQVINFKFNYADTNRFDVVFNEKVPEGTKVYVTDEKGNTYELTQGKYNTQTFEKLLVNGKYTVNIVLPEGYKADKNNFSYPVVNGINKEIINIEKVNVLPDNQNDRRDGVDLDDNSSSGKTSQDKAEIKEQKNINQSTNKATILPKTGIKEEQSIFGGLAAVVIAMLVAFRKKLLGR